MFITLDGRNDTHHVLEVSSPVPGVFDRGSEPQDP